METRPITLSPEAWKWLEDSAKARGLGTVEFLAYIVTYTRLGMGDPRPDRQPPSRYNPQPAPMPHRSDQRQRKQGPIR